MSSILTNPSYGAVAQLGERLPCTEEVAGSTPVSSTRPQWRRGRKVMRRIANPNCVGASPTDASQAILAQLVEQLICNQQVVSSNLTDGSTARSSSG